MLVSLETVLQVMLEDRPETLYRVQFWAVWRQEKQLYAQLMCQIPNQLSPMRLVVVQDQHNFFSGLGNVWTYHSAQLLEEFTHLLLVSAPSETKHAGR